MKKEAYYFSHDEDARNDPKILQMRSVYGMEGYGLFWAFVEIMRTQPGYKIPIAGKYAIAGYAQEFRTDPKMLNEYINDCISEFGLFESDGEYLWSNSLLRRMSAISEISERNRLAAFKRWGKLQDANTDAGMQPDSDTDADALQAQSERNAIKRNERKEKEIKENKSLYGEFKNVALTQNEYKKLTERFGEIGAADKIEELSQALQSRRGYPQKYKDHYATILAWNRRDEKGGSNGFTGTSGSHETAGGQKSQAPPPVAYGSRRRKNQGDSTADLERFATT